MENTETDSVSSMTDDRQPIKLEDLPISPLSKISSFLTLTDQRNFERINRSIFTQLAVGYFDFDVQLSPSDLVDHHLPSKLEEIDLESNTQEQSDRAPIKDELESLHLRNPDIIHGVDGSGILQNVKELNVCISRREKTRNPEYWFLWRRSMPKLKKMSLFYDGMVNDMMLIRKALETVEYLCVSFRNMHIFRVDEALLTALVTTGLGHSTRASNLRINHRVSYTDQLQVHEFELPRKFTHGFMEALGRLCKHLDSRFEGWTVIVDGLSTEKNTIPGVWDGNDDRVPGVWASYWRTKTTLTGGSKWHITLSKDGSKINGVQEQPWEQWIME